jgi:hypothetical protein
MLYGSFRFGQNCQKVDSVNKRGEVVAEATMKVVPVGGIEKLTTTEVTGSNTVGVDVGGVTEYRGVKTKVVFGGRAQ